MPPGCHCKRPGAINDQECNQFDCDCTCDLTAGVCDINCCCDEECGDHSFIECLDSGSPPPTNILCTETLSRLETANLKYPYRVANSPRDQLHNLICIEQDNSAVKGVYLEDQGYPRASQVFSPGSKLPKPATFHSYADTDNVSYGAYQQLGDSIATYSMSDQGLISSRGHLMLPSVGDGGYCIDANAARFGLNEDISCLRNIENLSTECHNKFNVERYAPSLVESEKDSTLRAEVHPSNNVVPAVWDANTLHCKNALKSLTYTVVYNRTKILDVLVEAESVDIGIETTELRQNFAINFVQADEEDSLERRQRSGNPGYIVGLPTLGATSPDTNETISHVIPQEAGFMVMDTGIGGQCSNSPTKRSIVGFAKDLFVGCTQPMTRQELKEFCTSNQHPLLLEQKIGEDTFVYPKWLETNQDYLGIFGNADPLDVNQWIKIESPMNEPVFAVKSRSWLDSENKCVGMPTKLRIEILWTHVGNVENPQAKILSAKQSYYDGHILHHKLMPNEKQPYPFTTSVAWTYATPKSNIVKSPPPTLIFSVPHDVFYPFLMNSRMDGS
ncbi:hypothetical protein ACHAXN_008210 [Cyclotella atomus]